MGHGKKVCLILGAQTVSPWPELHFQADPLDCQAPGAGSWAAAVVGAEVAATESLWEQGTLQILYALSPL